MNEKEGKSRVVKLSNCMWCDFFNDSKCDLGVVLYIVKEEKLYTKMIGTHKTYGPYDYLKCIAKRKEYNNEKKKIL